jgi:hypothetical protein
MVVDDEEMPVKPNFSALSAQEQQKGKVEFRRVRIPAVIIIPCMYSIVQMCQQFAGAVVGLCTCSASWAAAAAAAAGLELLLSSLQQPLQGQRAWSFWFITPALA